MMLFNNNELDGSGRRNFFVFSGVFLIIIILAGGGYAVWDRYFSSEAQTQRNYQKYVDWQANYDKAMREDTYGGKTPQETLDMFIAALRAGDVELAGKYFMLNEEGKVDQKWLDGLNKTKEEGKFFDVVNLLLEAKPDLKAVINKDYFVFSVRDKNGVVITDLDLRLNKYSEIWKIESL